MATVTITITDETESEAEAWLGARAGPTWHVKGFTVVAGDQIDDALKARAQ